MVDRPVIGRVRGLLPALAVAGMFWAVAASGDASRTPLPGFELMQYSASSSLSPEYVMSLDTNGSLLLACREARTVDELRRSGLEVSASQLELLRAMGLLRRVEGARWMTTFPILDGEKSRDLREVTQAVAQRVVSELQPEISGLRAALVSSHLEAHAFSVYYSYVLDGMVWGFFEEYRRVPVRRLSVSRPFWAGELWALDVERDALTTSTVSDRGMSFKVLWNEATREGVLPLLSRRDAIQMALREYVAKGRSLDGEAAGLLARFGVLDKDGKFAVPVIDEIGRDEVFLAAEKLTSRLVDWLLAELDLGDLRQRFGFRDEPQTLVVAYHELMWQVMDALEAQGTVERPAILAGFDSGGEGSLGDVVVVVDRARRSVPDIDVPPEEEGGDDLQGGAGEEGEP